VGRSLDLGFVRDLVKGACADNGRPSIDPAVFLEMQLALFLKEGLRSQYTLLRGGRLVQPPLAPQRRRDRIELATLSRALIGEWLDRVEQSTAG
jgi:hypothetical protein